MNRDKAILILYEMIQKELRQEVHDLQRRIDRDLRVDALVLAVEKLKAEELAENDACESGADDKSEPDAENSTRKIKVKYFADIDPIEELPQGSWIDLRCANEVFMKAGDYVQIPLGVAMELPTGYEAIVAPRSSTFRKYNILAVNSIGVIDPAYCGDNDEWHFLAYALRDTIIPKNDRICQFRILERQPKIEFCEVCHLGNPDRGGIGSTGRA